MSCNPRCAPPAALLAAGLVLAACAETPPTRFYTLSSVAAPSKELPRDGALVVGLGPVTLPEYLDRPQVVTRAGRHRVAVAEFASWIEPLDSMVPRVLADDLSHHLNTSEVLLVPQRRSLGLDYRVEIDTLRFDGDADGEVVLDARWRVFKNEDELIARDRSIIAEHSGVTDDFAPVAAAMSRALGAMGQDIARAIDGKP